MDGVRVWSRGDTAAFFRVPGPEDDKYSRGVVALRTGSASYPGAAVLGVEGAWRAGAGFVRFIGDRQVADAVLARRPETVVGGGDAVGISARARRSRIGAWVIGSGTDSAERTAEDEEALRGILDGGVPVVVDAGALDLAAGAAAPVVVTPHAGEFARLQAFLDVQPRAGDGVEEALVRVASALGAPVLLKGARTLVGTPSGEVLCVEETTSWLATAGTGDVLAGVIGAVLAANPGRSIAEGAAAGAWLHGRAGRIASGAQCERAQTTGHPIVAMDVALALPRAVEDVLA
ncbi:MAG: NAD(P)H-hydrate dehydratase [Microbacterium sp.]